MAPASQSTTGRSPRFPTTRWSKIDAVRGDLTAEQRDALNFLLARYWKPVYCYLRRRGYKTQDAEDLVQGFFATCLHKELFGLADPTRGRFRAFLLACLDRFAANVERAAQAQRRHPQAGLVSLHDLATDEDMAFEPPDNETPEAVFNRAWVHSLLIRVFRLFEQECRVTGKAAHCQLFRVRIIEPALEGAEPPPMAELAQRLGLTEKQASNCLLTARRAYQRLLREEIRSYASSDDEVASEVRDLFQLVAGS